MSTTSKEETVMPSSRHGLVVFDLDGTLLRGPTVCELLARPLGRLREMESFETLTTEAEIAQARVEIACWYNGVPRGQLLEPLRTARWAPRARESVARLLAAGVEVAIASITWQFAVEWFAHELGLSRFLGTGLSPEGTVQHVWARDKGTWLRELAAELGISCRRTAAIGDSSGDGPLLEAASLRFFVGAALPRAPRLRGVAHLPGGDLGEIVERILRTWAVEVYEGSR